MRQLQEVEINGNYILKASERSKEPGRTCFTMISIPENIKKEEIRKIPDRTFFLLLGPIDSTLMILKTRPTITLID